MGHPLMTAGDWEGSSKARGPRLTYAKVRRRKLETRRRVKMEGRDSFPPSLPSLNSILLSFCPHPHLHLTFCLRKSFCRCIYLLSINLGSIITWRYFFWYSLSFAQRGIYYWYVGPGEKVKWALRFLAPRVPPARSALFWLWHQSSQHPWCVYLVHILFSYVCLQ